MIYKLDIARRAESKSSDIVTVKRHIESGLLLTVAESQLRTCGVGAEHGRESGIAAAADGNRLLICADGGFSGRRNLKYIAIYHRLVGIVERHQRGYDKFGAEARVRVNIIPIERYLGVVIFIGAEAEVVDHLLQRCVDCKRIKAVGHNGLAVRHQGKRGQRQACKPISQHSSFTRSENSSSGIS